MKKNKKPENKNNKPEQQQQPILRPTISLTTTELPVDDFLRNAGAKDSYEFWGYDTKLTHHNISASSYEEAVGKLEKKYPKFVHYRIAGIYEKNNKNSRKA